MPDADTPNSFLHWLLHVLLPLLPSCALQWIGLVANAEFFCNDVQNEPLAEQLRERVR
jgi:hypothetical protein